jgi:hypothetical protein
MAGRGGYWSAESVVTAATWRRACGEDAPLELFLSKDASVDYYEGEEYPS